MVEFDFKDEAFMATKFSRAAEPGKVHTFAFSTNLVCGKKIRQTKFVENFSLSKKFVEFLKIFDKLFGIVEFNFRQNFSTNLVCGKCTKSLLMPKS